MEGKKKYIAIVLFLLIGLTIFTFANPVEEKDLKKEGKDGNSKTEVVEKEDKDKTDDTSNSSTDSTDTTTNNTIPVANTNNGGTGLTGNSGSNQEDNGYAKALAAVQVAESSLKANDVATAKDLVSKVTDQNQKTELTERINVVEEAIKAIELVDQLEKLVNESTSLSEMNIARDYRDNEEIVAIVSALKNTAVKETLTNRLNTLAKVLDDNNQPVITGVENNEITKEDVTLTVEDDNEVTITVTLNGSEIAYQDIFKEEGVYTVTALDAAFNSQTITFTIDKTAPTATLSMRTTEPTNKNLIVTLKTSEAIKTPKGWTKVSDTIYTKKYTRNTTEEVEIEDLAGNKSTVKIEITNIDKTAPTAEVIYSTTEPTNKNITVTLKTSEAVTLSNEGSWRKVSDTEFRKVFPANTTQEVEMTDKAGNKSTVKIEITNIDKIAPVATITKSNNDKATNEDVIVTLTTNETILTPAGWTEVANSNGTEFTKVYSENGKYEVTVVDKAGNETLVKFEVKRIDKVAPVVEVTKSNNDKSTNEDVVVTIKANEAVYKPAGWTEVTTNKEHEFTKVYSENGKYEVTVVDKAGNETLVKFEVKRIDKVAPVVEVTKSNNDKSTNEDVVVTIKANEAVYKPAGWTEVTTNKEHEFTKVYSENGKYEVTVVDKAGNETLVKFEVKRIDKEAPILTVISPNKYQLEVGSEYVDKGYSAYDTVDKDVTNLIKITYQFQAKGTSTWPFVDTLDTNKLGTYKVIYTAYDKAGNMTKGTRVVQIVDTTSPLLTLNGDKNITLEAGVDTYEEKGATAVDNYDGLIENIQPAFINYTDANKNLSKVTTVDTTKVGTYKIVYKYTDSSDNEGVDANRNDHNYVMRIVVVQDTINPTITVKAESIGTDPYYSSISFSLSDSNKIDYFEVNGTKFDRTDTKYSDANYQNIKSVLKAGENTITLYDTVGNKTEKKFYMDWTAPTITAHSFIGTEPNYSGMSFQLSDNYLIDYFEVNGTKYDRTNSKYSDANYQNIKSSLVNGENTLVLYDVAGNSSSYKFTLERIAPTITVADGTVGTGPYSKLNLKLYDASGIASVVINGTKLSHTGIYVDINDGHAYTFQQGTNTVTVTDNSGNVTTQTFEIDRNLDSTTTIEN